VGREEEEGTHQEGWREACPFGREEKEEGGDGRCHRWRRKADREGGRADVERTRGVLEEGGEGRLGGRCWEEEGEEEGEGEELYECGRGWRIRKRRRRRRRG